ncbi:hypothetical protein EWH70_07685 [Amycolatopsis suaedae]|uniref:Uncharacterized protein n=1 Tax=Amycolatopsis suaedae TaxID=2510978 RepID=A0A4Q7JAC6_9PSEU|nr:hypothetical protein EWH70_07685 [Amycolatopsis suaedae]
MPVVVDEDVVPSEVVLDGGSVGVLVGGVDVGGVCVRVGVDVGEVGSLVTGGGVPGGGLPGGGLTGGGTFGGGVNTVVVGLPSGPVVTVVLGGAEYEPATGSPLTIIGSWAGTGWPGTTGEPGPPPGLPTCAGPPASAEGSLPASWATAPNAVASTSPLAARTARPVRCRRPPGAPGGVSVPGVSGWFDGDPGDWGIVAPSVAVPGSGIRCGTLSLPDDPGRANRHTVVTLRSGRKVRNDPPE